jgi:hypothetical protein
MLGLVAAGPSMVEQGKCLVDSGEAVSDATDAALFIWAASKRCGHVGMEVKCTIDMSSAVKSVNSMINVILKAVDKCDQLNTKNKECGMQASQLTEHTAALTAAAAQVYQKCPAAAVPNGQHLGPIAAPVMCTVDLKNTAKGLFKAIKALTKNHKECKDKHSRKCTANVLDIVASLAGFGQYLAGTVGQCKRTVAATQVDTRKSLCAQATASLLEYTMEIAEDGVLLSKKCEKPEPVPAPAPIPDAGTVVIEEPVPRLYEQEGEKDGGNASMNLILGAFLPVTAIVSFVGGRFYANHRSRMEQTREFMSDNE